MINTLWYILEISQFTNDGTERSNQISNGIHILLIKPIKPLNLYQILMNIKNIGICIFNGIACMEACP